MHKINLEKVKEIVNEIVSENEIKTVVFVGCGASKSELYPAKYFLADLSKELRVAHYTANEFNYDTPKWLDEHTLVISASLGGSTPETIQANTVSKEKNAIVISLTKAENSALAVEADYCIVHGFDENYAAKLEKMGYALAVAVEVLQQIEGFDEYNNMIDGLNKIFDLAEESSHLAIKDAKKFAVEYKDSPVIYVMSSGASLDVAYSTSICLLLEMQWINSGSFHTGEYFHGPFEITEQGVPFVVLMNDGNTRPLDARAQTFLQRFDALTTIVDAKDYALSSHIKADVVTYFNPLLHTSVFRVYAEQLSKERQHPLSKRRYMWKLDY